MNTIRTLLLALAAAASVVSVGTQAQTSQYLGPNGQDNTWSSESRLELIRDYDWTTHYDGESRPRSAESIVSSSSATSPVNPTDGIVGGGEVEPLNGSRCFGAGAASYCLK